MNTPVNKSVKPARLTPRALCVLGMTVAAAMMLSYAESFIHFGLAGIKPGLANIFVIFILYRMGAGYAAAVSLVRCTLTALLFGSILSLWYSAAGAALSLAVMLLLKKNGQVFSAGRKHCGRRQP